MKKILLAFVTLSILGFNSCEKFNSEEPGNIPGLGNTPGELEVKEDFVLPEGIHILGNISGIDNGEDNSKGLKSKSIYSCFGSGHEVKLKITLLNSSNYRRAVFLPKGLVWECQLANFQHGLQVQTTWISLNPNESKTVTIDLYCANLGLPAPNENVNYKILGVTSSEVLWRFLSLIKWRMVNYEMIIGNTDVKTVSKGPSYSVITERFQAIIHNLTNRGFELEERDIEFIESIPELPEDQRPEIDENSNYPDYFKEFTISGK